MAERKTAPRKKREPKQMTFLQPAPQVKSSDILDVDEAAPHARVGRKLLFHKQTLTQWVADGADLVKPHPAKPTNDNEQLTARQLTFMLNNGQAKIAPKR
jgi:hypothetical protein